MSEDRNFLSNEFLTPKMVSKKLHLGINKTYRLFQLPDFPSIRIDHQYLVKEQDLYDFCDQRPEKKVPDFCTQIWYNFFIYLHIST